MEIPLLPFSQLTADCNFRLRLARQRLVKQAPKATNTQETIEDLKIAVFWDIAPCSPYMNRCFEGTCHLHLQGQKSAEQETSESRWLGRVITVIYGPEGKRMGCCPVPIGSLLSLAWLRRRANRNQELGSSVQGPI
jgi:hypothetical protein